jgi:hypothetical protein
MTSSLLPASLGAVGGLAKSAGTSAELDAISERNQEMAVKAAQRDMDMKRTESICDAMMTGPKVVKDTTKQTLQGA